MTDSEFLQSILLSIKAAEPMIWIDTPEDDWIVEALKRDLTTFQIEHEVQENPDFENLEKINTRRVVIWVNVSNRVIDENELALQRISRRLRTPLTLVIVAHPSERRPDTLAHIPIVTAPLPSLNVRKALIQLTLGSFARDTNRLDRLIFASAGLTRTQLYRILARSLIEARENPAFDAWEKRIVDEKKRLLACDLSLEVIDDPASLDEVGGMDELKIWLRQREAVFGDDARKFGLMPPRGLLLVGIQGCGKSLIAKAIANAWKFPLLRLDMSSIFAGSQNSPDAVLQRALRVADAMAPAVIWCDEIEKAFAEGADPTTRRLLGHILNWLQERRANSFFVATANDVRELPSELIRKGRFDELFFVDLPDEAARADIFSIHLRKRHRDPANFDCSKLAAEARHFSGAEIEQAVIAGLFAAFAKHREITQDDILDAIQDIVPLYKQREDDIKRLREWASERTRQAANNARVLSYFS
ncbi:MAG: AAA family ATPase [Proteobacteria bacterium]|nr:AAA family ATPase [Pseudomonadota bacterium]